MMTWLIPALVIYVVARVLFAVIYANDHADVEPW